MTTERSNLLSPSSHAMNLRKRGEQREESAENGCDTDHLLLPKEGRDVFITEPREVVNMGLQQIRVARGTATRKLRTVKRAWGTFKAKMRPEVQKKIRPQQLWSVTACLSSPQSPSARNFLLNSPLDPNQFVTPGDHHQYRPTQVGTPLTPLTPMENLRRSARIAGKTPTPLRDSKRQTRRVTPKRIRLSGSPGRFTRDLNSLTVQFDQQMSGAIVPAGVSALKALSTNLQQTISNHDSSQAAVAIPAKKQTKQVTKEQRKTAEGTASKENELEPKHRLRLRRGRGVVVSCGAGDGQMLTENWE
ncbi:uncharacterized protein [Diadema antillarum]|uniref:uncharacterized protein n=1 Tax=Diadema antillarum TaxID=105358 RepID=UPI003A887C7E